MKRQHILLVEDNPDDVKLTLRALDKARISNKVVVVVDGAEALEYLNGTGKHAGRDPRDLPQVILLDLKLPGMNGIEVLQRIRSNDQTKLLPVVILTTSSEERDMIEAYSLGANSYIRKPVDFQQFAEAVQHLGLYWLVLNAVPWQDG
ncbi:MAG: response regulator [Chloroflexi bacterium]|nr:response regulator [Chloroflexota bacterium]